MLTFPGGRTGRGGELQWRAELPAARNPLIRKEDECRGTGGGRMAPHGATWRHGASFEHFFKERRKKGKGLGLGKGLCRDSFAQQTPARASITGGRQPVWHRFSCSVKLSTNEQSLISEDTWGKSTDGNAGNAESGWNLTSTTTVELLSSDG